MITPTMFLEMVLERKPLVDPHLGELEFKTAVKTRSIRAKPLIQIINDKSILAKFLLDTLEGNQVLKAGSMVCLGINNDVWQQTSAKLLGKYTVAGVDEEGWMLCEPKPDVEVLATQIPESLCTMDGFSLVGLWGDERIVEGKQCFLQYGLIGDYVVQSTSDPNDRWVVRKSFFEATYDWKK